MDNILDIVNRIENAIEFSGDSNVDDLFKDAVDEIKRLRAALRMFACACADEHLCSVPDNCRNYLARAALEGK